uniref:Uncharacterized protein n=1 Tax=Triticum urartu TaxID=4572 RepID=A0A8R7P5N2_TRIUA
MAIVGLRLRGGLGVLTGVWRRAGCRLGGRRLGRGRLGPGWRWRLGARRRGREAAADHADDALLVAADDAERQVGALAHAPERAAHHRREAPEHALHHPVQVRIRLIRHWVRRRHCRRRGVLRGVNGPRGGLQVGEAGEDDEGDEEGMTGGSHAAAVVWTC